MNMRTSRAQRPEVEHSAEEHAARVALLKKSQLFRVLCEPEIDQPANLLRGVVDTNPEVARALLESEELVVVLPGDMCEALLRASQRFKLRWEGHKGFARLALDPHAPVILAPCPAANLGFAVYANPLREFLDRQFLLHLPLARGVGPSLIPRPVKLTFHYSKPIPPPQPAGAEPADREIIEFRDLLERRMNVLTATAVKGDGLEQWVERGR